MLTFGWGEIFLLVGIIIVVVGPKDLPKLIKQLSSFTRSIKKLSREFDYIKTNFKEQPSLNDIADHEDFKEVKTSINEVNKIKEDLNIEGQLKSEIQSIKDTTNIIDKEVKDIKNIHNK